MDVKNNNAKIYQKWKLGKLNGFSQPSWRTSTTTGKQVITLASMKRFEQELQSVPTPRLLVLAFQSFRKEMPSLDLTAASVHWSQLSLSQKQVYVNQQREPVKSSLLLKSKRSKKHKKKVRFSTKVAKKT